MKNRNGFGVPLCIALAVSVLTCGVLVAGDAREEAADFAAALGGEVMVAPADVDRWQLREGALVLHDNGQVANSPGTGAGGADESILQTTSLGMNILGFGHQQDLGNRVSDDFAVPSGHEWTCSGFTFYAYQTGSDTTSTMSAVTVRVWDDVPQAPGSNIVEGDTTTDKLDATAWSGAYRVTEETTGTATDRPIMMNDAVPADDCSPAPMVAGCYWVDWDTDGTLPSGPWAPPITITGQTTTGNGLQSTDGGVTYLPLIDTAPGTETPQGLPFLVHGSTTGPTLTVTGDCPGPVTITIAGGRPNGSVSLVSSPGAGCFTVPTGGCTGATLGVSSPSLLTSVPLNSAGGFSTTVNAPASVCGLFLEALDLTTCEATTIDSI